MKVSDYIECIHVLKERFDEEIDRSLSLISIVNDVPFEELELMPIKEVQRLVLEINNELSRKHYEVHSVNGFHLVPNNRITLGNFIDLETYIHEPDDLTKCFAILYRKQRLDDWGNAEFEPVKFDIQERANVFLDFETSDVVGRLDTYKEFRNQIVESYKAIFGLDDDKEEVEPIDTSQLTKAEIREIEQEEKKKQEQARFSWESFVYWLSDNSLVNVEQVLNFPVVYALNMASMRKVFQE